MIRRCQPLLSLFLLLALLAPSWAWAAAQVTGLQLVSSARAGRTTFDYTYRITVLNGTPALSSALASVTSPVASTQVVKGSVLLGNLAAGVSTTSTDTFTIRQDRTVAFNPALLVWTVTGVPVLGAPSMDISLSEPFVAPDGSVTVTPVVRDGNGVVISNAGLQFNVTVLPVGTVTGNAPVVTGLVVTFPKLVKRLLNQNLAVDPAGEFASTDPTDPQYGKETGGKYRVTAALVGSSLNASKDTMVLPTGTAQTTFKASQYAGQLGSTLALAFNASQNGDAVKMAQARVALQAVDANRDFSFVVLSATNSMAPPDGGLITPQLLTARGFVAGPQDAQYAATLTDLVTRIRHTKAQVNATNVAALTQAAVDALVASGNAYKQSLQTLQALQLSTLGAAQQQAAINQLLATELPQLLDAVKLKSGALLGVTTTASIETPNTLAGLTGLPGPWLPGAPADAIGAGWHTPHTLQTPQTPQAMYAMAQPVQFFSFFSTMFGFMTDLSGAARGNIIELSITLANSLLNIQVANVINQGGGGGLSIDYCLASSSFAFVCPDYMPTRIGGSGFGRDVAAIKVAVVGCLPGNLLRNLATLSVPSNIAAAIRLINKVVSITNSLRQEGGVAAVVVPDFIAEDDFGLGSDMLYFGSGWPRVNQGRLPCVGIVIVMNTQSGGLAAVNLNFLPRCG